MPTSRFLLVVPAVLVAAAIVVILFATVGDEPAAEAPTTVRLDKVADGFAAPVALVAAADGSERLFVVDQIGVISVLTGGGRVLDEPLLDLADRLISLNMTYDERGLLGMALHPDFARNGRFFVYYSAPLRRDAPDDWNHTSRISEFTVSPASPDVADPESERVILEVDQPQTNHNAGQLAFGPDGYLYIALGDGGRSGDTGLGHPPAGNGQDTSTLLGSILRIDVDGGYPYAIPTDNPFAGGGGREEVFAFGLRNPFRFSFDAEGGHEMFVGDVGQNRWEEISIVGKGDNLGWNIREGGNCFDPDNPRQSPGRCPDVDSAGRRLVGPIIEYRNAGAAEGIGTAVIGGFVYRGTSLASLSGAYVFADFTTSRSRPDGVLFVATRPATPGDWWSMAELEISSSPNGRVGEYIRALGQDADNELLLLTSEVAGPTGRTGKVYRIRP